MRGSFWLGTHQRPFLLAPAGRWNAAVPQCRVCEAEGALEPTDDPADNHAVFIVDSRISPHRLCKTHQPARGMRAMALGLQKVPGRRIRREAHQCEVCIESVY